MVRNEKIYNKQLKYIGGLLREYRFSNGLSQSDLSSIINVHRNTISNIEQGKNITLMKLFEMTDGLEIDLVDLFSDIDDLY